MNLIIISDIYENLDLIDELVNEIELKKIGKDNIILIAGDLGSFSTKREQTYIENLKKFIKKLLEVSSHVLFVTGECDKKNLDLQMSSVVNLHNNYFTINTDKGKIGFLGYGGAPIHSIKQKQRRYFSNLWDEKLVNDDITKSLKLNYEKLRLNNPDKIILLTHTPPYNYMDHSKEISFAESLIDVDDTKPKSVENTNTKKAKTNTPKHLGSKSILNFIKNHKIDFVFCGHIHKEGGKIEHINNSVLFNVSHFDILPYKLTGRKYLILKDIDNLKFEFHSLTTPYINFEEYIASYL